MKTKDILTIATTALGTATLTVAFLASPTTSGTDANSQAVTIAKPKLVANGIEMTLSAAEGRQFKAGDQPAFELRAVNTLNQPSEVAICASMSSTAPSDRMSRLVAMPAVLWQEHLELALRPNETKVLALAARTNLPANRSIMVVLGQVSQDAQATIAANAGPASAAPPRPIMAMAFSTVAPMAAPASADVAAANAVVFPAPR